MNRSADEALRERNMAVVAECLAALNAWDFEKKRELLDDDAFFEMPYAPPPFRRSYRGKEEILAFLEEVPALIESENHHEIWMETLASDPGEIVCTFKSDCEIKPTGTPYRNRYISRWTVRDGKVTYFAEFYDAIALVEAMGGSVTLPDPPG
jgi:uncharacterized protein